MHGCKSLAVSAFVVVLAGCVDVVPESSRQNVPEPAILGEAFVETLTGDIRGIVKWNGDTPSIAPFKVLGLPGDYTFDIRQEQPNPNAPKIGPGGAVEGAVVFLRHVDLKKSKPWDHPDARIEQRGRRLVIRQGQTVSNVGFVRAGTIFETINLDDHFHMLRGRGADFFSLPLPRPNLPSRHRALKPGIVNLSSGAFFFWMHGYLLVDEHPYYTRTDARGRFTLEKVPIGSYELICWMPNWEVRTQYRDPDTGHIIQVDFEAPIERAQAVQIDRADVLRADFTMSLGAHR